MVFLRLAVVDTPVWLSIDVPPNWTVFQLKRHLERGLAGLLTLDATDMRLYAGSACTASGERQWIAYTDADAVLLLHGHVTDRVQQLLASREMSDASRLRDFGFDDHLDAVHVLVRRSTSHREDAYAWIDRMRAWLPMLPWACLVFTLTLFVVWLDTVVTWVYQCQSNFELLRNLPWVVLSLVLFVASIFVYLRDIAATQARKGYAEIA